MTYETEYSIQYLVSFILLNSLYGQSAHIKGNLKSSQRHFVSIVVNMEELSESSSSDNAPTSVVYVQSEEKSFSCTECWKSFPQKFRLNEHFRVHTQEKPYTCGICGTSFNHKSTLTTHIRLHTQEKPFMCSECGMGFSQKSSLNGHMRIHTNEKPFSCSVCDKSFKHKNSLNHHYINTHLDKKPYPCPLCDRSFIQSSSITMHMRIHSKERPFKCMECGQGFARKCTLVNHMRTHTLEKPYSCSECGRKFNQSTNLTRHMKVHNESKRNGSHKKLDLRNFMFPGNDEAPVISTVHNKISNNDESKDALKPDPDISSGLLSSSPENEDATVCSQKIGIADEFISIKEEIVLPEDKHNERHEKIAVLDVVYDTKKSLSPESLNLDFPLVKMEDFSDNEGDENGVKDPLGDL